MIMSTFLIIVKLLTITLLICITRSANWVMIKLITYFDIVLRAGYRYRFYRLALKIPRAYLNIDLSMKCLNTSL